MDTVVARSESGVVDAVNAALEAQRTLEIVAGASKREFGTCPRADAVLDVSALAGIVEYEPGELVLTLRSATSIEDIEALLGTHGQMLAFEPRDYGPVFRAASARATIGGVLACNCSGPRRVSAGAARDHFLGFRAVSGRGEVFKAGGRVVKNVTGYDLPKLLAGSFGTLAVLTEVSVRTVMRPEATLTLLLRGLDDRAAVEAMGDALGSTAGVSAAAHLPAPVAARYPAFGAGSAAVTALRLEGIPVALGTRRDALALRLARHAAPTEVLDEADSIDLWRHIRDLVPFACDDRVLWRLSVAPAAGAVRVEAIRRSLQADALYDWGGGLVWLAVTGAEDGGMRAIGAALHGGDGHATLVRAPPTLRARGASCPALAPGLAALSRRVRDSFDPRGVFDTGRIPVAARVG